MCEYEEESIACKRANMLIIHALLVVNKRKRTFFGEKKKEKKSVEPTV